MKKPVLHNLEGGVLCTVKALLLSTAALASFASTSAHAQASPSAYTSATRYDGMNRVTGTILPDPDGAGALKYAAVRNTYSLSGNLIKVETGELSAWQSESTAPSAWSGFSVLSSVETSFDVMGRKVKDIAKGSDGNPVAVTQYSYDTAGRLECTAVRMNPSVYGSLPASACSLGTEGSQGKDRITRQSYDAAGQLLVVQKAYGTALQQDYVTYTYTNNGKQASVKDANGNLASLTYDGHDRLVQWNFPSKTSTGSVSSTDYEQYGYDANGNKTTYRKRDGSTLTYSYDALNRMTVKTVPERSGLSSTHTRDVYYGYDLRGLQLYARYDSTSGEGVSSTYDGFGRVASSSLTMDGATRTLSYQWDRDGNRIELTWPDSNKTSYSYDGLDRMATLYEGGIGSTVNMVSYGYNNRSLRASQAGRYGQSTSFSYDAVGRLNSFGHDFAGTSYDVTYGATFTPVNQIATRTTSNDTYAWTGAVSVSRSYAVNGLNQYTSVGGGAITYDDNGNLTSSNSITYQYDVENRLVSASGAVSASLRYDPLGRLYEVTGSSGTTRFLYDGDELVAEYNTSGTLLRRYAHGTSVDDPVVWYEGASIGPARWLHTNWQGSVVAVTDSSGSSIATNSYDEWGIPAATNQGRFQYTGQAWLPEIGMYYYKARIYSPTLGRFMQTDPVGYKDQVNLYAYVGNDPVNFADPTGTTKIQADAPTGSHIRGSVDVDADGDGSTTDKPGTLTQSQKNRIGHDFAPFINANNGRNLSSYGKSVIGNASSSKKAMTRVVSQFVGYYLRSSPTWNAFGSITANETIGVYGSPELTSSERIKITGYTDSIFHNFYDSPSNLARLMFHGYSHIALQLGMDEVSHTKVDSHARNMLSWSGLDGGGCWRISLPTPFSGSEVHPGC